MQFRLCHQVIISRNVFTILQNYCFVVSEDEVLYQNYQEKALHNDSDEDTEPKQPQPDKGIVVQYKPIRTSWSQLSVVRNYGGTYAHLSKFLNFDGHIQWYTKGYLFMNFNTLCCGSVWEFWNLKCHPALFCWVPQPQFCFTESKGMKAGGFYPNEGGKQKESGLG